MLDIPRILTAFRQLVGWRQPIDSEFAIIDASNNTSNSGKFFQDYTKSVRIENIQNSWPLLTTPDFNTKLAEKTDEAIVRASQNAVRGQRDVLESKVLYHFQNDFTEKIDNISNKFVGYEVALAKQEGIALKINSIMTQFDEVRTFNLFIYHSSQKAPIFTIPITTVIDSVKRQSDGTVLYYQNEIYVGGTFYIGYYQNDLTTTKAYNREFELADFQNCFEWVYIRPISVPNTTGTDIFDVNDIVNEPDSFGLNFDLSVYNDFTQLLIDNVTVMEDLIGFQTCVMLVDGMTYNNRNNDIEKSQRDRFLIELKGLSGAKEFGLEARLESELERTQQLFFPEHLLTVETMT